MLSRLLNFCGVGILYFAASMFFAQSLLFACLVYKWDINKDKLNQMVAVAQGYDIYLMEEESRKELTDRLQQAKYDEVLQLRANRLATEDMDKTRGGLLEDSILAQIRQDEDRKKLFDEIVRNFEKRLADVIKERESAGFIELTADMQLLTPELAKKQIMKMIDDKREDRVVEIVNAMEEGPRKKLLNAMKEDEEVDKLADILRRIGDGEPEARLAKEAQDELTR